MPAQSRNLGLRNIIYLLGMLLRMTGDFPVNIQGLKLDLVPTDKRWSSNLCSVFQEEASFWCFPNLIHRGSKIMCLMEK